jgi:hypothetical protein
LQFNFQTNYRLTFSFCMVVVANKLHYMGKYQPIPLVCCGENLQRMSKFDPSESPRGLGLTLIYSRSTKKRAIHKLFGRV